MTEMMTEKTSEKGDIRMITLTEKDADSVISLLKEMQSYRKNDLKERAEKIEMLKGIATSPNSPGIFDDLCKAIYEKTMESCRKVLEIENNRFQSAILLLTAGSETEKKGE